MPRHTSRRLVTFAVMVATFLVAMDTLVMGTAMPTVIGTLGGLALYSWVFSAYLLTSTVTVPVYGKLADLYGRKPVFLAGSAIFLLGSALSGTSQSMEQLVLFRALQGLGGGAVLPITVTIIGDIFPLEQRARVTGLFAGIWGISSILGPALGGFITDHLGWRWVFYINLPAGAAAMVLLWLTLHEDLQPRRHRIDFTGAATLTAAVSALMLGLQLGGHGYAWTSWPVLGLLGGALALLAAFVFAEFRAAEPLLPPALLRNYVIAPASAAGFLFGAALFGVTSFVPAYVQGVLGGSASTAGLVLAPMSLAWTIGSTVAGRLLLGLGYRAMGSAGAGLILLGTMLLAGLGETTPLLQVVGAMAIVGLGLGFNSVSVTIAVQNAVAWNQRGTATSSNQFFRSIGGTLGVSLVGAVFTAALAARLAGLGLEGEAFASANTLLDPVARSSLAPAALPALRTALAQALHTVFLANVAVAALGLVAALQLPGGRAEAHAWREEAPGAPAEQVEQVAARR
ncbi:MAG: MFS transporter [Chloroflexi bacterium]|nr:MFS transporter [Chloroflexota bacterium]